jgi:glycosyltransferase involved in cell wall biosynthesis
LAETIGPYEKGQVWAEPSIEHAAEYLVALAANPKLRSEIGGAAKAKIEALYSPTAVAELIKRRYEEIVISI